MKTDSAIISGIELLKNSDENNSKYIISNELGVEKKLTPHDINEYRLEDGTIYRARTINIGEKVFLEVIEEGKLNLYYLAKGKEKKYFLENDTLLVNLKKPKSLYTKTLSSLTNDHEWRAKQYKLVTLNRESLAAFVSMYNDSLNLPLPFNRFGVVIGLQASMSKGSSKTKSYYLHNYKSVWNRGLTIGIFGDFPIDMSNYSIHAEILFSKNQFVSNYEFRNSVFDAVLRLNYLDFPLLLRYSTPRLKNGFFINAGPAFRNFFDYDSHIYETKLSDDIVLVDEILGNTLVRWYSIGACIGGGMYFNLSHRNILSAEFRFSDFLTERNWIGTNQFMFQIGVSL